MDRPSLQCVERGQHNVNPQVRLCRILRLGSQPLPGHKAERRAPPPIQSQSLGQSIGAPRTDRKRRRRQTGFLRPAHAQPRQRGEAAVARRNGCKRRYVSDCRQRDNCYHAIWIYFFRSPTPGDLYQDGARNPLRIHLSRRHQCGKSIAASLPHRLHPGNTAYVPPRPHCFPTRCSTRRR